MITNIHEKLIESIQVMLVDTVVNLPYYGNFCLFINFIESKNVPTCGVNMSAKGMNFYYNSEFLEKLSQKEVNFITVHEDFHLLWDHPKRTVTGIYNPELANIAQDMIINYIILEDMPKGFAEIPKDDAGKNMTLIIPKEYTGKLIFENVYEWLKEKKEEHDKKKKNCSTCNGTGKKPDPNGKGQKKEDKNGQGDQDQKDDGKGDNQDQKGNGGQQQPQDHNHDEGEPCPDCGGDGKESSDGADGGYGPYGKNPKDKDGSVDSYSLDHIFDNLEKNKGQYMDVHMGDEIPEEMRESVIKEAMERLQSRGFTGGDVESTLEKLRKKRKDYLREIKRCISNLIFGTVKQKTIVKPNRRQISGLKGNRKMKTMINVIVDSSGSMSGLHERVLSYIYRNNVQCNMIIGDVGVKDVKKIKDTKKLDKLKITGFGGTEIQPHVDMVVEKYNDYNSVILTDGFTDTLDLSKLKGRVLIITAGVEVPISKSNGKVKQIVVEETN